jgi:hypothetical protein
MYCPKLGDSRVGRSELLLERETLSIHFKQTHTILGSLGLKSQFGDKCLEITSKVAGKICRLQKTLQQMIVGLQL